VLYNSLTLAFRPTKSRRPRRLPKQQPTQIERIYRSIQGLYSLDNLEKIQHYYFAPWDRKTPYEVLISKLSKAEAAKAHNQQIENLILTNSTTIYTDASSMEEGKGIGVGVVVYDHSDWDKTKVHQENLNIGPSQLVYNGELEGVTRAIEHASKTAKQNESIRIFSDNQAGLRRLKTPSDNPGQDCQIRAIRAAQQIVEKGATVTLE
jgi:ribonuclease HI